MFLSNNIWWYCFHHPNKLPRIRCALHERFKPPVDLLSWIFYFSSVKKMALGESIWDEATSADHRHFEYFREKNVLTRCCFIIDPRPVIYGQPESLLESKARRFPGQEATTFSWAHREGVRRLVLRRQPSVPLPCTGGLSPWPRRSLSLPAHLNFFQSSLLLTFNVPEKNQK